jgi:hypothetical protein
LKLTSSDVPPSGVGTPRSFSGRGARRHQCASWSGFTFLMQTESPSSGFTQFQSGSKLFFTAVPPELPNLIHAMARAAIERTIASGAGWHAVSARPLGEVLVNVPSFANISAISWGRSARAHTRSERGRNRGTESLGDLPRPDRLGLVMK